MNEYLRKKYVNIYDPYFLQFQYYLMKLRFEFIIIHTLVCD